MLIASLGGAAEVRNSQGRLVARLVSGAALTLSAANPESVDLTGVVSQQEGKFYLTDNVTKVKVELNGKGLSKMVGKVTHVTGTLGSPAAAGATQVVIVESATVAAAAGTGAGVAAAGAGSTIAGVSTTTVAIAGGVVAVGGTVGGLAAAGTIGGSSSVSR